MMEKVAEVKNLSVQANSEYILRNITFNLFKHEVLFVVGPNGAGKSTLLKAMLGLVPYTGSVHWQAKNISYVPPQELIHRRDLPPMTVRDFFMLKEKNVSSVLAFLELVGLHKSFLNHQFSALSTGEFQRMLIAWALVDKPDVLLLDEPLTGIDIGGEKTLFSFLHTYWKEKKLTMVIVSHDLQIVWQHATRVVCINKELVCSGEPEKVLTTQTLERLYKTGVAAYEHRHR